MALEVLLRDVVAVIVGHLVDDGLLLLLRPGAAVHLAHLVEDDGLLPFLRPIVAVVVVHLVDDGVLLLLLCTAAAALVKHLVDDGPLLLHRTDAAVRVERRVEEDGILLLLIRPVVAALVVAVRVGHLVGDDGLPLPPSFRWHRT
ncbi:unnamed protein product [Prorocentrum cordatum]|uniref:Secreted protein n=1 Tax=Prorocentrum cordatum TaxID=2364126 RepID=A0ABN9WIZ4_9DINO|nr:unnamed protein product [Polarella glacialis]